ncbi:MAG: zinc ribbon domain-containing protein, partial [bacterium]
ERAYRDIQEIEMDREMEKLSEEDYAEMIARARAGALDVLGRLEARGVREGMAPANLDGREAARAAAGARSAAGARLAAGARSIPAEPARSSIDERLEAEILAYREVPPSGEESPGDDPSRDESGPNFCPACGQPVDGGDNFCASCGKKIG